MPNVVDSTVKMVSKGTKEERHVIETKFVLVKEGRMPILTRV